MTKTFQEGTWSGTFGKEYTERSVFTLDQLNEHFINLYGYKKIDINNDFLKEFPRNIKILEIGCNVGNQLNMLQSMGFNDLYGIELQQIAVDISKKHTKNINIIQGSALDLPFKDKYFDLVYTTGVLIHISPDNIDQVMGEISRVSKKYIWGLEYYNEDYIAIKYRGNENLLWKGNFPKIYMEKFPDLSLIKEKKYPYVNEKVEDQMYLLSK